MFYFLLIFAIFFRNFDGNPQSYQLLEHGPHRLKEIFFDLTISYIDACFTPDSTGILAVPTKYPHLVFLINLPLLKDDPGRSNTIPYRNTSSSIHNSIQIARSPTIHFEPRTAGPICIFGPSIGAFGNPLAITHIESNEYSTSNKNQFYFITWNDDGYGEYCLWHVIKSISTPSSSSSSNFLFLFRCIPRLLHSVFDQAWLEVRSPFLPFSLIPLFPFSRSFSQKNDLLFYGKFYSLRTCKKFTSICKKFHLPFSFIFEEFILYC